jgi:RNA polymerase primary sigma factor
MSTKNRDKSRDEAQAAPGTKPAPKKDSFMSYEEVNESMPSDAGEPMDDMMGMLGDEEIQLVDGTTQVKIAPKRLVDDEPEDKTKVTREGKPEEDDNSAAKSHDPVRVYLRNMGSIALLTREGEVEIAKRIEDGEHRVLSAILNSPVAVREIVDLGEKLRKGRIRVKELVRDAEEVSEDEQSTFDGRGSAEETP